jgi:hypothetical protein
MIPVKYDRRKQNCLWEFLANVTVWFYMFFFFTKLTPNQNLIDLVSGLIYLDFKNNN